MAEHLNEIVNYLDEQDRLTRNKLIGIGIVCGLELHVSSSRIEITKGCGVTSAGYLLVQDQLSLTYYRPYTLPTDFSPKYKPVYENWQLWELLTAEQSLAEEDALSIEANRAFMRDKIVLLLLEMKEKPLKNCVDTDCDDKGDKIEFAVKPLLVKRSDIDEFLKSKEEQPVNNEPAPSVSPALLDVKLKRFNVPVNQLTSTDVVLNAFLELVDENTLKRLAQVLNYSYLHYKPILFEEASNPFGDVFEVFKARLAAIKNTNPFFIQYFYDWLDDIHKAYHEFKRKVYDVQVACCPDEDLFPLHLMLGEATKSTSIHSKSNYRHYFLYSPLFNNQKNLLAEVQSLFRRMRVLVQNFTVPSPGTFPNTPVRITPSKYLDKPISNRCIPYYYNPEELYQCWNWSKTRRGKATSNLSYHAAQYNSADAVVNPLLYDIERFNFFRVEGHIGKSYGQALTAVISQRNSFNLPFEVVALSTATVARYAASDDKNCLFNDLESLYKVIIAELSCRFGDLACLLADVPYRPQLSNITGAVTDFSVTENIPVHTAATSIGNLAGFTINPAIFPLFGLPSLAVPAYKRGDFFRSHCTVKKGTVGEVYQTLVARGHHFVKPSPDSNMTLNTVYAHLFYFIDSVENVMGASWPDTIKDFTPATFTARFAALTEEVRFIAANTLNMAETAKELRLEESLRRFPGLINTCFDERLAALKKEYEKRYNEVRALANFMNYFKKHPGLEHKAGVPKGGTFILVYHETPAPRLTRPIPQVLTNVPGAVLAAANLNEAILSNAHIDDLLKEASVKDPVLLKNFELALGSFLNTCRDMEEATKLDITDILIRVPQIRVPDRFRIPEFAVIADFYLPYICCSDCPPITYVLPKEPEVVLSIRITPTEFCNNDEGAYPVTVSPEGGVLSASVGGVAAGSFQFKPKGIPAGTNKITYTLADGRSTSVDVKIVEAFEVDFRFQVENDGITVNFFPSNTGDRQVTWDFGDGVTTTEQQPSHTYQLKEESESFTVKLTVRDVPCLATKEHTFTLKRPERTEFGLVPEVFCSNDRATHTFKIAPTPKNVKEIKNEAKLVLERNPDTGEISFIPAKQNLQATKEFPLSYREAGLTIKVVVPNADFIMVLKRIQSPPNTTVDLSDFVLHVKAKEPAADDYQWRLLSGDRQLQFSGQAVDISYRNTGLSPQNELLINLRIFHQLPGAECMDEKRFIIDRRIFDRFLDKEEFDNHTTL